MDFIIFTEIFLNIFLCFSLQSKDNIIKWKINNDNSDNNSNNYNDG